MVVVVAVVLVVELTVRLVVVMVVVDLECVKTARYQERVFCVGGSRAPSAAGSPRLLGCWAFLRLIHNMVTMLCWLRFDIVPLQLWVRLHLECEGGGGSKVEPCNLRLGKPVVSV